MNYFSKWLRNRAWSKKYDMPCPKWLDYDIMDSRIYDDPTYHQWLSKLSNEERKDYGMKMQIVGKGLDKLSIAIDDELIKRGNEPDKENV